MNNLKLNLTPEQEAQTKEILRAVGSKDKATAMEAQETIGAFVGPVIDQVLDQTATSSLIFQKFTYNEGEVPSIPLDLFEGNEEGLITVWSETLPGGLATNHISGMDDYRFTTETLTTAVSCLKQYMQNARMDVVTLMIRRMVQELLLKSEYMNWSVLLGALAQSRTGNDGLAQVYAGSTAGVFKLADLNTLWTKLRRLRTSWAGGSTANTPGRGLTHLLISPEVEGDIRAMAYNPVNTTAVPDTNESTVLPAPDSFRNEVFKAGGLSSLFGVQLVVLNELGVGQPYNAAFDSAYTPAGSEPTFDSTTQEIVIGVDSSVPAFLRIVENGDGGEVSVSPDDQWVSRSKKVGWYAERTEGRIVTDSKAICGIVL